MTNLSIQANYYQQFDADFSREIPGEGYGGWQKESIEIGAEKTGFVVMHAWDTGPREDFPGWHRAVEYIPRADAICREVFPSLLEAIRASRFPLFHVVGSGDYYQNLPGYRRAMALSGPAPPTPERVPSDSSLDRLRQFRSERVFVGLHNADDVRRGFARLDFAPQARPVGYEGIAENGHQLFALCKEAGINHLIYMGFAINWCLLLSPGGMAEMSGRGVLCSAIREAVTAVENRDTARDETAKELGLWRVALAFGFVFDLDDILTLVRENHGSIRDQPNAHPV